MDMDPLIATKCPVASLTFAGAESGLVIAVVIDPANNQQLWAVVKPGRLRQLQLSIHNRNAREERNAAEHQFRPSIVGDPEVILDGLHACNGQVNLTVALERAGLTAPEENAELFVSAPGCTPLPTADALWEPLSAISI